MRFASMAKSAVALATTLLLGCGPAAPAASPADSPRSSASESTPPPMMGAGAGDDVHASIVRFDDLGISFTVPPGYRVIGDEELAARVRSSADLRLNRSLRERAAQKKGIPLLTLEKQTTEKDDFLTLSLAVVLVPKETRAMELVAHEQAVMTEHLAGFRVTEPAKAKNLGTVDGAEISTRYQVKRGSEARRAASNLRLYVRDGIATIAVAVWPEESPARGEEARLVLDALRFYDAVPAAAPVKPAP